MQAVPPPQPPLPLRWAEAVRNVEAAQQVCSFFCHWSCNLLTMEVCPH